MDRLDGDCFDGHDKKEEPCKQRQGLESHSDMANRIIRRLRQFASAEQIKLDRDSYHSSFGESASRAQFSTPANKATLTKKKDSDAELDG